VGKLRSKSAKKGALGKTEIQQKQTERFYVCPKGHRLPHQTNRGNCTPDWCAGRAGKDAKQPATLAKRIDEVPALAGVEEQNRIVKAETRRKARLKAVEFPETPLEGGAAEEWADKEIIKLLPEAVAELKFNLRYGDDQQREKAADKILAATGRGKKESGGGGAIFNVVVGAGSIPGAPPVPFLQRVQPQKLGEGGEK